MALNRQSNLPAAGSVGRDELEESRRHQLIEVTIDSLAEVGFVGTTLGQIASRAGVSPGLVAHYFGEKDGLLVAAFRALAQRTAQTLRARMRGVASPRGRIQAVIDATLAPEEFDKRTGTAWLAFWGQVLHAPGLRRIQRAYQRRMLSNLRHALASLVPQGEAARLAAMIAAMIDGVWLRAALSDWHEADSGSARAMLTAFVEAHLSQHARRAATADTAPRLGAVTAAHPKRSATSTGEHFVTINPATGQVLAELGVDGPAEIERVVAEASAAQAAWARQLAQPPFDECSQQSLRTLAIGLLPLR